MDSSASGQGTVSRSYEHGDELSVFVKREVLLDSALPAFPPENQSVVVVFLVGTPCYCNTQPGPYFLPAPERGD